MGARELPERVQGWVEPEISNYESKTHSICQGFLGHLGAVLPSTLRIKEGRRRVAAGVQQAAVVQL